ncbi:hypothetical protein LWI29_007028 [Acer saccharum]|uniref:PGG domain-containing protein n=1 Tax=Acer saccharum TaxID=4024 RepID=A0AA39SD03_ACESA|nr:hypothetical protein LWI29_007028 [Acer saccharum]
MLQQPNGSPSLQQPVENVGVQVQPNVEPSLQQPAESVGVQVQPNGEPSLQQPAESGGPFLRPPNHVNYMSINGLPAYGPLFSEAQNAAEEFSPSIKIVRDAKLKHECAVELVNLVVTQLSSMSFHEVFNFLQNPQSIIGLAIEGGIEEIVRTLLQHFPDLIEVEARPQQNILQAAIEYRQEKIVNILKENFPTLTKILCSFMLDSENTTLHLAGKLAPEFKLFSVSGAALQMQRELQWFKEAEKMTYPYLREMKNENNQTAKDLFRIEHKELAKQGEEWMKATANSGMIVSTLIATVLFAAAFTLPGGNVDDKGIPIFLRANTFLIFIISVALGLVEGSAVEDIMGDGSATRAPKLDDAAEWRVSYAAGMWDQPCSCGATDEWALLVGTRPDGGD